MPKKKRKRDFSPDDFNQLSIRRLYEVSLWYRDAYEVSPTGFLERIGGYKNFFSRAASGELKALNSVWIQRCVDLFQVNANFFYSENAPMFLPVHHQSGNVTTAGSNTSGMVGSSITGMQGSNVGSHNGVPGEVQLAIVQYFSDALGMIEQSKKDIEQAIKKNEEAQELMRNALVQVSKGNT